MLLALPQDIHDWAFKSFATTRKREERCGSRISVICIGCYPPYQLFDVEHLVHRKQKCGGRWWRAVAGHSGGTRGKTEAEQVTLSIKTYSQA